MKSKVLFNTLFAVLFAGAILMQANVVKTATAVNYPISAPISYPQLNETPWTGKISVATWVKLSSYSGSYPRIISKLGSFELIMYTFPGSAGRLEWDIRTPSEKDTVTTAANKVPLNTWTHVAATYDGSVSKVYINGVKVAEKAITGSITKSNWGITVGSQSNYQRFTDAFFFHTIVDTTVFSDQDIQNLFQDAPQPLG